MQVITISAKLLGGSERKIDKAGHEYIRFKASCKSEAHGKIKTTIYRCYCYNSDIEELHDGEIVFLSGDIDMNVCIDDNGKAWMNCDVYVRQIERASKYNASR